MDAIHLSFLSKLCKFSIQNEDLITHASDATEDLFFKPDLVLFPEKTNEIQSILSYCNLHKIMVYTRGAGTGLSGGALAVNGGIVISTKNLNKIIQIDTHNFTVTVEPGVINYDLRQAVEAVGLFYPPDPASYGTCSIGGNVAHSSGGPKCVKYGTTKDYVLNIEMVLPTGEILWTGANTVKNATGYNLTQLVVGSEGTLGIITKIVLKLIPLPTQNVLMLAGFDSAKLACDCVNAIMMSGITPSACELMQLEGMLLSKQELQLEITLDTNKPYYLLVELDGNDLEKLMLEAELIYPCFEQSGAFEVLFADNAETKEKWWKIRRAIGSVVKSKSVYKEEDTVVPRYYMPLVFDIANKMAKEYGFEVICYGHAGDGNIHINILKNDLSEDDWENEVPKGIKEIFEVCKKLGGTISGEHGIGYVQKDYLPIVLDQIHFTLMKGIKNTFDPNAILNTGKWI